LWGEYDRQHAALIVSLWDKWEGAPMRDLLRSAAWLAVAIAFPILFWATLLLVSLVPYLPNN
jgi:hypothetical protein